MKDATHHDFPIVETSGTVATVVFNRPLQRNSLSLSSLHSLSKALSDLTNCDRIHAIIFTGQQDVFLSGADIGELASLDRATALEFSSMGQKVMQGIADARQVMIAAINGFCMGGGLDFALACKFRFASSSAVFAHPGSRLGIITGWCGTQRLPRIVGRSMALEIFTTGRRIASEEALKIGLVTSLHDPVMEAAMEFAQKATMEVSSDDSEIPQFPSDNPRLSVQ